MSIGREPEGAGDVAHRLRPMGYRDLINEAFDLYKRNALLFTGVGLAAWTPYWLLWPCAPLDTAASSVLGFGFLAMVALVYSATIRAVADRFLGLEASITGSWRALLRRLLPYGITWVAAWTAIAAGAALLVLPGLYVHARTFFLPHGMLVEGRFYADAFQRAGELAAGRGFRILIVSVMMLLLALLLPTLLIALAVASDPSVMEESAAPLPANVEWHLPEADGVLAALIFSVILSLLGPLPTAVGVLLYFDTRIRKEGFDIEWLARAMATVPSSQDRPPPA